MHAEKALQTNKRENMWKLELSFGLVFSDVVWRLQGNAHGSSRIPSVFTPARLTGHEH
jgi:hypothetical protein